MNARAAQAIAGSKERRPLAGDQLYVDLDLSIENLPAGTRLAVGDAVIEVTPEPHTGCAKFSARFGTDALKFVNKSPGRELRLRGVNTRVVTPGTVRAGDCDLEALTLASSAGRAARCRRRRAPSRPARQRETCSCSTSAAKPVAITTLVSRTAATDAADARSSAASTSA